MSDLFGQLHGNSVADEFPDSRNVDSLLLFSEAIGSRETLEQCALAKRYCAVLLRVPEATTPKTKELRGEGRRGLIPFHAAVNARVTFARPSFVAVCYKDGRPIFPAAARHGGSNAFHV